MRKKIILLSQRFVPYPIRFRLVKFAQHLDSLVRYRRWNFVHSIAIEISEYCNRTCHYCPNSTNKTPMAFMSEAVFDTILDRLRAIGWAGPIDYNFYNEPTFDHRLPDLVRRTVNTLPKALPRIITNGDYLDEKLMDALIEAGVVNFAITRHPPFSAAWDSNIARLRRKYPDYIKFGEIWNAPHLLSNRGGAVEIKGFEPITSCMSPHYALNIMRNGDVVLCCADYHKTHPMGNILRQSIWEIWDNPTYKRLRKEVWNGKARIDICRACFGLKAENFFPRRCWHCGLFKPLGQLGLLQRGLNLESGEYSFSRQVCQDCAKDLINNTAKYRYATYEMPDTTLR